MLTVIKACKVFVRGVAKGGFIIHHTLVEVAYL